MDAFLAVASKREVRDYAPEPLPEDVERRILDAGRVSGSSKNRQPWRFLVLRSPEARERVAEAVWAPGNLRGCALAVAIAMRGKGSLGFDAGRVAQNMMLAAWNDGVGSCPNGIRDAEALAAAVPLEEGEQVHTVLSFGYPARAADPGRRAAQEWIDRADRRPPSEVVIEVA
jgi:nitroreductase